MSTETIVDDAAIEAATASLPKCPTCGGPIWLVQFIAHQTQRFNVDFNDDGNGGVDLDAYSCDTDTLDVEPLMETTRGSIERAAVVVECKRGHAWPEPRLSVRSQCPGETQWYVRPAASVQPELQLVTLPSGDCAWLRPEVTA